VAEITIREAGPGDVSGIVHLLRPHEPEDGAEADGLRAVWHWLYQANPCAVGKVLIATDPSDRIVAHEGVVPFRYRVAGRLATAGLPCKLVVEESHRRSMLFPRLELRLLRGYPEQGIDFLFTPMINHKEAHFRLGFVGLGDLPIYARPFRFDRLARRVLPNALLRALAYPLMRLAEGLWRWSPRPAAGLRVERVARFDSDMDEFLEAQLEPYDTCALRTASILNWRFAEPRGRRYALHVVRQQGRPVGYVVLRRMKMSSFDVLALVDLLWDPQRQDVAQALRHTVHLAALEAGVELATCMLNPHSPLLPHLSRWGFLKTPEAFELVTHSPNSRPVSLERSSYRDWHITWFEHDYV
jgi:hypothetical protein